MPQGLARAMAAAELACKTAKNRGRNRVELYACEDDSMMRRHDDALAVGQLRAALKADRLMLYAQRIAPLQDPACPGGYEMLCGCTRRTEPSCAGPADRRGPALSAPALGRPLGDAARAADARRLPQHAEDARREHVDQRLRPVDRR